MRFDVIIVETASSFSALKLVITSFYFFLFFQTKHISKLALFTKKEKEEEEETMPISCFLSH
jgi:hypothetical protein